MDYDLPEFDQKKAKRQALPFAKAIFKDDLVQLDVHDDGRCRAIFKTSYFTLQRDNAAPTKSQWGTLKKKLKRHNRGVFIFKETGETLQNGATYYYIDFGFFKY